jgi:hypothetical protein
MEVRGMWKEKRGREEGIITDNGGKYDRST